MAAEAMRDEVNDGDRIRGAPEAPVTIVEYGDFQCPNCKQAAPAVALLLRRFAGKVRVAFRHYPLEEVHAHALAAAEAAEAAGAQGLFWEMHDLLFAHQPYFRPLQLRALAQALGLDLRRFSEELESHIHVARIREDAVRGRLRGVRATPTFYVNGVYCDVSFGIGHLRQRVASLLGGAHS
jgi:protein-disulfide isomerase